MIRNQIANGSSGHCCMQIATKRKSEERLQVFERTILIGWYASYAWFSNSCLITTARKAILVLRMSSFALLSITLGGSVYATGPWCLCMLCVSAPCLCVLKYLWFWVFICTWAHSCTGLCLVAWELTVFCPIWRHRGRGRWRRPRLQEDCLQSLLAEPAGTARSEQSMKHISSHWQNIFTSLVQTWTLFEFNMYYCLVCLNRTQWRKLVD